MSSIAELLDALPMPIGLCDDAGCLHRANPALWTLLEGGLRLVFQKALVELAASATSGERRKPLRGAGSPDTPLRTAVTLAGGWRLQTTELPADLVEPGFATMVVSAERYFADLVSVKPSRARVTPTLVSAGEAGLGLTARETEVAALLVLGQSTRSIAAALSISYNTARRHIENVLRKLGAHSRVEVVVRLLEQRAPAGGGALPSASARARPTARRAP